MFCSAFEILIIHCSFHSCAYHIVYFYFDEFRFVSVDLFVCLFVFFFSICIFAKVRLQMKFRVSHLSLYRLSILILIPITHSKHCLAFVVIVVVRCRLSSKLRCAPLRMQQLFLSLINYFQTVLMHDRNDHEKSILTYRSFHRHPLQKFCIYLWILIK